MMRRVGGAEKMRNACESFFRERMNRFLRATAFIIGLAVASPGLLTGQAPTPWDGGRLDLSREALLELQVRYEQTAASNAFSSEMRAEALAEAEAIRVRLESGDFRTGDEVVLTVQGEPSLTGPFTVNNNRALTLPVIGEISLQGVLRSELHNHLADEIAKYLVNPQVTAYSSVRIMMSGNVTRPGFYVVPTQDLLSSTIMEAGGPAPQADLSSMRIERAGEVVLEGAELQTAIAQGWTIDQLGLRSGDNIVIPELRSTRAGLGQMVTTVLPAILLVLTSLTQLF